MNSIYTVEPENTWTESGHRKWTKRKVDYYRMYYFKKGIWIAMKQNKIKKQKKISTERSLNLKEVIQIFEYRIILLSTFKHTQYPELASILTNILLSEILQLGTYELLSIDFINKVTYKMHTVRTTFKSQRIKEISNQINDLFNEYERVI